MEAHANTMLSSFIDQERKQRHEETENLHEVPCLNVSILNIGYGLGLIDNAFQRHHPLKHTIIEAHNQVIERMNDDGFENGANGIRIFHQRWQDAIGNLIRDGEQFDAIFFDTFGEYYEDMREFHGHLPLLLKKGGVYSFFNGLAPDNIFFQAVYSRIIELELKKMVHTIRFSV